MTCLRDGEYTRQKNATTITAGIKTCEVNIGGVTTKYVSKDDYDALKLVHEALQVTADVQRKNYLHHVADLQLELLSRGCTRSDEERLKTAIFSLQQHQLSLQQQVDIAKYCP